MTTDTVAAPTLRRLWQMPTFLLGLAAFAAVWQGWVPVARPDAAASFRRDLAALRTAYDKLSPEAGELDELLKKVAQASPAYPELGAEAHLALGSGYVRLAEITAAPDAARAHWHLARQHFDHVRPERLTDPEDPPRFAFRSAKARVAVGLPPNTPPEELRNLVSLLNAVPVGEDMGEARRLCAEVFLRADPPQHKLARDQLAAYVAEVGLATPAQSVARVKLRLSEIHLKLNEPDAARKWLDQIGPDAPPDVLAPGKAQRAKILMTEAKWADAAKDWELVRAINPLPPGMKPAAAYYLGVCRLALRETDAAAKLFEESAKSDGPEGAASSIRLAEIGLQSPDAAKHAAAGKRLSAVVANAKPGAFTNPLIQTNETQAAFEMAVKVLLADSAFDDAEKVAVAYKAVAPAGRDREKRAEVLAEWGAALAKAGGQPKPKFAAAAAEYVALAEAQSAAPAKADFFRRAASLHRQAGDAPAAIETLDRVVKLPALPDDVAGPAWVEYAEALVSAGRTEDVTKALNNAMATASAVSAATRYRLARACIDSRNVGLVKLGTELLDQVANASTVGPADQQAHERALVERAHDFIQAKNYAEAEWRLRKLLNIYPTGPESGLSRLLLGVSVLGRSAATPEPPDAPKLRDEALGLFQAVAAGVDAKPAPTDREKWLRVQASIRELETFDKMGKPYDLMVAAHKLRDRTKGTVEELIVLSLLYRAHKQTMKDELALRVRDEMKQVFQALPASAFTAADGDYSRVFWETKWFASPPKK
jgi:tetratricopeptide (TPR) repeat protein